MNNIKNNMWAVGAIGVIVGLVLGFIVSACVGDRGGYRNKGGYDGYSRMGDHMMMGDYNAREGYDADQAFLKGMIMHHEGAIIMSEKLLETTTRPELVKLGNDIITAQTTEIKMMKEWEAEWFK